MIAHALYLVIAQLPALKLEYSISVGNIVVVTVIFGALWKIKPVYDGFLVFRAEHELLMSDLAERRGMRPIELRNQALADVQLRKANGAAVGRGN